MKQLLKGLTNVLCMAPKEVSQNIYTPSKLFLKLTVDKKSNYDFTIFKERTVHPKLKVLLIGTESDLLEMNNGKFLKTGNNPIGLFVPLLHFEAAGFEIDFATPTGKPLKIEEWGLPIEDEAVMSAYRRYEKKMKLPISLKELAPTLNANSPYAAVFIPGGHGTLVDLPNNNAIKQVINWALEFDKWMVAICFGAAALLSAQNSEQQEFPFKGYKIASFQETKFRMLLSTGYLPGKIPWNLCHKLQAYGMCVAKMKIKSIVQKDKKLITGNSAKAANKVGKLAVYAILNEF